MVDIFPRRYELTYWRRVIHICVGNLNIIDSDYGLSPGRRQAIMWINAGTLSIGPLGTNFTKISIEFHIFPLKKMHLKMSFGKWRPFCLGLNVLRQGVMHLVTVMFLSSSTMAQENASMAARKSTGGSEWRNNQRHTSKRELTGVTKYIGLTFKTSQRDKWVKC